MRDAATAAAMSDPDQNRWFRRRWNEQEEIAAPEERIEPAPRIDLDLLGHELLLDWRRQRAVSGVG